MGKEATVISIYATIFSLPEEDEEPNLPAPIVYHHSGQYPDPKERGGWLEIGVPPGHIINEDEDAYCPYLRVGISDKDGEDDKCVVLDVTQVDAFIEALQEWRARVIDEPHSG